MKTFILTNDLNTRYQILNHKYELVCEKYCKSLSEAIDWANNWMSGFPETYKITMEI